MFTWKPNPRYKPIFTGGLLHGIIPETTGKLNSAPLRRIITLDSLNVAKMGHHIYRQFFTGKKLEITRAELASLVGQKASRRGRSRRALNIVLRLIHGSKVQLNLDDGLTGLEARLIMQRLLTSQKKESVTKLSQNFRSNIGGLLTRLVFRMEKHLSDLLTADSGGLDPLERGKVMRLTKISPITSLRIPHLTGGMVFDCGMLTTRPSFCKISLTPTMLWAIVSKSGLTSIRSAAKLKEDIQSLTTSAL